MRIPILLLMPLCLIGCGGSSSQSPGQIVFGASGASPTSLSVPSKAQVRFVNQDTADHQIASSDCSELASPKMAANGDFTATLGTGPKSCTFSDGLNPSAATFKGTITVAAPPAGGGGY